MASEFSLRSICFLDNVEGEAKLRPGRPTLACRATRSVAAAPNQSTQASRMDVDAIDVNLWDPETTIPAPPMVHQRTDRVQGHLAALTLVFVGDVRRPILNTRTEFKIIRQIVAHQQPSATTSLQVSSGSPPQRFAI